MAEVGDKYIIEIAQVLNADMSHLYKDSLGKVPKKLYRVFGFNSLVFDEQGLEKLDKINTGVEQYYYEEGYKKGSEAAWEFAKTIINRDYHVNRAAFGTGSYDYLFSRPYSEIKDLEEHFDETKREIEDKQKKKINTLIDEIGQDTFNRLCGQCFAEREC